jgi:hypothetical protein
MTWLPSGTVTVQGTDFTQETLAGVSITYGRENIWDQARASYAQVQILNLTNIDNNFELNDSLVITLEDSAGVNQTVFTGRVTDISANVQSIGSVGEVVVQTLTAIGPFADMARKVIGTSAYPKEYDDDRMSTIFTEAGVAVDVVDTPGVYEFTGRSANPSDAYSLAQYYAQMAFGYIYETTNGEVGYANESRRSIEVTTYGYWAIPENYILSNGITSNRTLNDIINSLVLTYKNNASVNASDATSIGTYGEIAASIATELEKLTEAQIQADRYITLRANPETNLSEFTVQLDSPNLSNADLDDFIGIYMGKPIQITGLPIPLMNVVYRGFVEGWTLSFTQYQAQMTLRTTDSTLSIAPTRWQDVSAALIWSAVDPAIQWFQYE